MSDTRDISGNWCCEHQKELAAAQKEIRRLHAEHDKQISSWTKEEDTWRGMNDRLRAQLAEVSDGYARRDDEVTGLIGMNNELSKMNDELRAQIAEKDKQLRELGYEWRGVDEYKTHLQRDVITPLKAQLAEAQKERDSARKSRDYWRDEADKKQVKLVEAQRDAERLRNGLKWYADGNHWDLNLDWHEEEGWLCPPTDDPWMVEPGYVARHILDGQMINPDKDADEITIAAIDKERGND